MVNCRAGETAYRAACYPGSEARALTSRRAGPLSIVLLSTEGLQQANFWDG